MESLPILISVGAFAFTIYHFLRNANKGHDMTENEKVIEKLEWFKSELLRGDKVIEYYQAQVDILMKAIKLTKRTLLWS